MKILKKIQNTSWLKKDFPLPKKSEVITLIFLIALPNLIFLLLAFYGATSRPLINIDYLFALIVLILPFKWTRILGSILFILAMLIDALMH